MTPPERLQLRLIELAALPAGWLDGEGESLDPEGLIWAAAHLLDMETKGLPYGYLYPTPEGNLSVEWDLPPDYSVDLLFDLKSQTTRAGAHSLDGTEEDQLFEDDLGGFCAWLDGIFRNL